MNAPDKQELLERERRTNKIAGILTLIGVALFVASIIIKQSAGTIDNDTDAERLLFYHEHASTLILGDIIGSIGFALFCFPLYALFRATTARTTRVRRAFVAFAFIGPILLGAQGIVSTIGYTKAADTFVQERPTAADRQKAADAASGGDGGGATTATETTGTGKAAETTATDTTSAETTATDTTSTETTATDATASGSGGSDDEDADPREQQAKRLIDDQGMVKFGTALIFPGLIGFVVGMVYIPLWAMRVGLMARFWATLGMALGVSVLLLPFAQILILFWFAHVAFLLTGWRRSGRPPAWDAGVAVPWPRPGEAPPPGPGEAPPGGAGTTPPGSPGGPGATQPGGEGTVEGTGRELGAPEEAGAGEGPGAEQQGEPHPGSTLEGTQGERRKKRKRR